MQDDLDLEDDSVEEEEEEELDEGIVLAPELSMEIMASEGDDFELLETGGDDIGDVKTDDDEEDVEEEMLEEDETLAARTLEDAATADQEEEVEVGGVESDLLHDDALPEDDEVEVVAETLLRDEDAIEEEDLLEDEDAIADALLEDETIVTMEAALLLQDEVKVEDHLVVAEALPQDEDAIEEDLLAGTAEMDEMNVAMEDALLQEEIKIEDHLAVMEALPQVEDAIEEALLQDEAVVANEEEGDEDDEEEGIAMPTLNLVQTEETSHVEEVIPEQTGQTIADEGGEDLLQVSDNDDDDDDTAWLLSAPQGQKDEEEEEQPPEMLLNLFLQQRLNEVESPGNIRVTKIDEDVKDLLLHAIASEEEDVEEAAAGVLTKREDTDLDSDEEISTFKVLASLFHSLLK